MSNRPTLAPESVTALVAGVGLGLGLVAGVADAAFYYEATTTTEGQGFGRNGQVMRVVASIDGPMARIEFVEGGGSEGLFQDGSYLLTTDAGSVLYIVNPEEMTYAPIDFGALFGFASAMLDATGGAVQIEFKNLVNEKLGEGPGENLLGYETTRLEFRTSYTMSMGVFGFTRETTVDNQIEIWCTDEIDAAGFNVWLRPDRFRTGNENFDALIQQQYQDIDCLPLRMRTQTMNGDQTSTSTTEVTELREQAFEPSVFALPEGYTETSFIPEIPEGLETPPPGEDPADAEQEQDPEQDPEQEQGGFRRFRDLLRR